MIIRIVIDITVLSTTRAYEFTMTVGVKIIIIILYHAIVILRYPLLSAGHKPYPWRRVE